ncbi:class E sortase [Streptomyces sp. Rer75]|uniref:class E sortase n=1 Tax=Streptomyces sp. Rer75 TaxID=2750011 RepID=UPI0015D04E64|nr:class E sortase [Streptomyces sp. Rer75]QLH22962.1 class E sortase [Streptomyces sp. Rer75]
MTAPRPGREGAAQGAPESAAGAAPAPEPRPTGRRRRARPTAEDERPEEAAAPPTGRRRATAPGSAPGGSVPNGSAPGGSAPGGSANAAETAVLAPVTPAPPAADAAPEAPAGAAAEDDETVALRAVTARAAPAHDRTVPLRTVEPGRTANGTANGAPDRAPGRAEGETPPTGGRAARRKAAQEAAKRGGRHGARARGGSAVRGATGASGAGPSDAEARPRTRMEAKRAARARKDSPGVVASRVVGEVFITLGVVMLLFVTYQLWWTNILAHQQANGAAGDLQKKWDTKGADRDPGVFSPGQGFAIIYIPKLDVKAPIAEGIDKHKVLDRGMVGHYAKGKLKTAMPWDKKGNFALAGHRNTHGEPFRYINRLKPGDKIVVETQSRFYTYDMTSILPQTSPSNTGVIGPVPPGSGFTKPGRYLTLTTCTPEFTSTYRMIVWGRMVDERPRSEGKPDALVE